MRHSLNSLVLSVAALASIVQPASAADLRAYEGEVVRQNVPLCDDPRVLAKVEDQFEYGAPRMLEANLEILEFRNLFEKAYFPERERRPIERRYCQGEVVISGDIYAEKGTTAAAIGRQKGGGYYGDTRTIYYIIEYPLGFAAAGRYIGFLRDEIGWNAEGCVLGLDEWRVYGANCESLRRF